MALPAKPHLYIRYKSVLYQPLGDESPIIDPAPEMPFSVHVRIAGDDPASLDEWVSHGWIPVQRHMSQASHVYDVPTGKLRKICQLRTRPSDHSASIKREALRSACLNYRVEWQAFSITDELEELYLSFRLSSKSPEKYCLSIEDCITGMSGTDTFPYALLTIRDAGRLIGASIALPTSDAFVTVMSFHHREYSQVPGFMILSIMERSLKDGLRYYLPPYFVEGDDVISLTSLVERKDLEAFDPFQQAWVPFDESMLLPSELEEDHPREVLEAVWKGEYFLDIGGLEDWEEIDPEELL